MPLPALNRWERLQAKRGVVQKRSARYTKPGFRPRASSIAELKYPEGGPEQIPGRPDIDSFNNALKVVTNPLLDKNNWFLAGKEYGGTGTLRSYYPPTGSLDWEPVALLDNLHVKDYVVINYVPVNHRVILNGTSVTTSTNNLSTNYEQPADWITFGYANYPIDSNNFGFSINGYEPTKKDQLRAKIRVQLGDPQRRKRYNTNADFTSVSGSEIVALQMLKGMVNQDEWKRYLRYGFILVKGISGLIYQIIRNNEHIKVYRKGNKVAELCISVRGGVPPTDQVVAKKIMLECNEMNVWHEANIRNNRNWSAKYQPTEQELVQLVA